MKTFGTDRGVTVWFTGPPAAGKTTVSELVHRALTDAGFAAVCLDADDCRKNFWPDLDMSPEGRIQNLTRLGRLSAMLNGCGLVTLVAAISPYENVRKELRISLREYVEVYCKASLEARMSRDFKGLYAKAKIGLITGLTGYDAPYEEPASPEIVLSTDQEPPARSSSRVVTWLADMGYLQPQATATYSPQEEAEIVRRLERLGYV